MKREDHMTPEELLLVIPHSGMMIPKEIPAKSFSEGSSASVQNKE
jgi:hypothetical protein